MLNRLDKATIESLKKRTIRLFLEDETPWVVGYSGGKDSTAALQLVWYSILDIPVEQRMKKAIHVISTDTQVEQPLVASWVEQSLEKMRIAAQEQNMPIVPHRLTPTLPDSYWVNLIGRGYPAPRPTFRWCTSRLKIQPSNRFILDVVKSYGETILVLGTRRAESSRRASNMAKYETQRTKEWLSPNGSLPNSFVYTPLEDWSTEDVWFFLMQYKNPWGCPNRDLLTMYRGATADNECPLVIDTSTPSCGNSRFGCWVCTLVSSDKSMEAMIANDEEKIWMAPLLELRNEIACNKEGRMDDRDHRDYRRMDGSITLKDGQAVHGPYLREWREHLLRRLLQVQEEIRENAPAELRDIKLLTDDQLREIRRIWVLEKHEFIDSVPRIFEEVTGSPYPYIDDIAPGPLGQREWMILQDLCRDNYVLLDLQASILDTEQRHSPVLSKKAISLELESHIKRCFYENEEDAVSYQKKRNRVRTDPRQLMLGDNDDVPPEEVLE